MYDILNAFRAAEDDPLAKHVPMKAGDVLIFTEALTHGTMRWTASHERRQILLKYCPHYMQWSGVVIDVHIDGLTDRQKLILEGPHVWQRETV